MATPPSGLFAAPLAPAAPAVSALPPAAAAVLTTAVPIGMGAAAGTIGALLAAGAGPAALIRVLVEVAIAEKVAGAVVRLAGRAPAMIGRASSFGPAQTAERRTQVAYRAAFIVNSAWRLQKAWTTGGAEGFAHQLHLERRYFAQHLAALRHRAGAAHQVDTARQRWGPILGWRLGIANEHTPECVAANGHRFTVVPPPIIGLPGTVHARCACYAGPDPGPGAGWVDDAVISLMGTGVH